MITSKMKSDLEGLNNFDEQFIESLFAPCQLADINKETKIFKTVIPDIIWDELLQLTLEAKKVKSHPLSQLKCHYNAGKNSYQISVNQRLFEESFLYPYIIFAGQKYLSMMQGVSCHSLTRKVGIRQYTGHYDGYDFWFNFSEIGDVNPPHRHSGSLSAVIYISNTQDLPTIFEGGFEYNGISKEMLIFPSNLQHQVAENTIGERITASFNLQYNA